MTIAIALLSGLIFGIGLIVSGMSNPAKVLGFLDLGGNWDPSLALVMAGAIGVGTIAFRAVGTNPKTLLGVAMSLPGTKLIDRRLVLGALLFGAGWGLAGFCPGPALASITTGGSKALLFVGAMVAGMGVFELLERR